MTALYSVSFDFQEHKQHRFLLRDKNCEFNIIFSEGDLAVPIENYCQPQHKDN